MPFDGLRPYLETLERKNLLKWVEREVDRDWEIATVVRMMFRAMPEERRVGVGFRNVRGFPGARVVAGVVAASSDMIATVPERHTAGLRAGLHSFPLPFGMEDFTVSLLWHPRMDGDQAHGWLRGCIREICAKLVTS